MQGAVAPSVSDEDQHAYYDPSGGVRRDFDAATLGDIGCSVPPTVIGWGGSVIG